MKELVSETWVMYKRTSRDGEAMFFVRPKHQFESDSGIPDSYDREVLMETDDYDLAEKAMKLAEGD